MSPGSECPCPFKLNRVEMINKQDHVLVGGGNSNVSLIFEAWQVMIVVWGVVVWKAQHSKEVLDF